MNKRETVFILDGSSFLYRAYYSVPPMHTKTGQPVQVIYGFCRMIKKVIRQFDPGYFAVAWDSSREVPTVRHTLYDAYKAGRSGTPNDLQEQREPIKEFCRTIDLCQIERPGIEADDILFSLARDFSDRGYRVVLITSDKDMQQCINENVTLFDPFKDCMIDRAYVELRYGIPLEKIVFYFSLVGDSSDNIPGARGIGPKIAQDLVNKFVSLEDMYLNLDAIASPRVRELLAVSRENVFFSYKLFSSYYYSCGVSGVDCSFLASSWFGARAFFEKLSFTSLLKDFPVLEKKEETVEHENVLGKSIDAQFITVSTPADLHALCDEIMRVGACAIDTETDSLDTSRSRLVGISICTRLGVAYYIPLAHQSLTGQDVELKSAEYHDASQCVARQHDAQQTIIWHQVPYQDVRQNTADLAPGQLALAFVVECLKPLFKNPHIKKYFHHAKFDMLVLARAGLEIEGLAFDTLIAAHLVTRDWQRIGLKWLSEFYLDQTMLSYEEMVTKQKVKDFSYVSVDKATVYAAADAHQTFALVDILKEQLKLNEQEEVFSTIEMPLVEVLYKMEREGILADVAVLDDLGARVTCAIQETEAKIYMLLPIGSSTGLNLNSPRQLEDLLFNVLQLTPMKKTTRKTGYSTDQEVLNELAKVHPVPALIIKYRELYKIKSTYIDSLRAYIYPETHKIYTSFRQTATATGRLSSSDPNLQNIPTAISGEYPIRSAFKAPQGHLFLSADYSQIELRVLAYLSQDQNLLQAFVEGRDIHSQTAASLFDISLEAVKPEQRSLAKTINFGILYGLSAYGLSRDLGISYQDAKSYIEKYFAQYPGVVAWMEKIVEMAKLTGYVQTLWGRRRYVPGIYETNKAAYELARRIVVNTAVQGTAAELMKKGMLLVDGLLSENKFEAKLLIQIHDELLLVVPQKELVAVEALVCGALRRVVDWKVPLEVTVRTGEDWQEATK